MVQSLLALILLCGHANDPYGPVGKIQGIVVNGTHGNEPIGDINVVLRAGLYGVLTPVAETKTDLYGKFVFDDLPLDATMTYLPGADRHGVHYPGERVRVDKTNRIAHVKILAFDAVRTPSPLVAGRHDIDVNIRQDVMEISETLVITNPSRATYVGVDVEDKPPVTLRLSVPPNFDRVTFGNEFFGRRFRIVDHQPVTDIPWPPGNRELKFTYRIPLEGSTGQFCRPLDVPCINIRVRVRGKNAEQLSCNLPFAQQARNEAVFATGDKQLRTGYIIQLQIGTLPFPWMQYARWSAVGVLCALICLSIATHCLRDGRTIEQPNSAHCRVTSRNRRLMPSQRAA